MSKKQQPIAGKSKHGQKKILPVNDITPVVHSGNFKTIYPALFLAALSVLLYMNTFRHGYVLDDEAVVSGNFIVQKGIKAIPELLKTPHWFGFNGGTDGYRPLSLIMFCIEWQFFPGVPGAGHVMNVVMYALTGALLFVTLKKWLGNYNLLVPFFISLLFIAHPVHTEVVANIKSRDELLSFFFSIYSIYFLHGYVFRKQVRNLWYALICFFLAMISKENAVMFLFVIPLLIGVFSPMALRRNILISSFFMGVLLLYGIIRMAVQEGVFTFRTEIPLSDNALVAAPGYLLQLATAIGLLGKYLLLMIFPHPLISDYSYGYITWFTWTDWRVLLSLFICLAMLVYAVKLIKKQPLPAFAILYFFITLSLVANIFFLMGATLAERFLYMPSLGLCMVYPVVAALILKTDLQSGTGKGLWELFRKHIYFTALLLSVTVLFSFLTISRNPHWKSNIALFTEDVKLAPDNVKLNYYYATAQMKQLTTVAGITTARRDSILNSAYKHLNKSLALYPGYIDANHEMGNVYFQRKDFPGAIQYYEKAVRTGNRNALHYSNYGTACVEAGLYSQAEALLQKAIHLNPYMADAIVNMGACFSRQQKFKEAIEQYEKALSKDPVHFTALKNIGSAYGNLGNYDTALDYFNRAFKVNPDDAELNSYMGLTYQYKGDTKNAGYYFDRAQLFGGR